MALADLTPDLDAVTLFVYQDTKNPDAKFFSCMTTIALRIS